MIRRLISCTLFAGLGTGVMVGALLVVLPSVRITGGAAATTESMAVRAVLIEGMPGSTVLAAPDAWRRCPYLAAVAAGSGCPYLEGLRCGAGRCPALPPSVEPAPRLRPEGAVRAAFAAPAPVAPAAGPA